MIWEASEAFRLRIYTVVLELISTVLVQFSRSVCPTLCNPMDYSTPSFPVHHQLLELAQTHESVMPSNHLIPCCPLLLPPSIFPSIRVFSNKSVIRIRWPKCWVLVPLFPSCVTLGKWLNGLVLQFPGHYSMLMAPGSAVWEPCVVVRMVTDTW